MWWYALSQTCPFNLIKDNSVFPLPQYSSIGLTKVPFLELRSSTPAGNDSENPEKEPNVRDHLHYNIMPIFGSCKSPLIFMTI